jgi:hypothetical protein
LRVVVQGLLGAGSPAAVQALLPDRSALIY